MTPSNFDKNARTLFSSVLEPHGFSCEHSRYCTFSRQVSSGIWHFIAPDLSSNGAWFDVKVFPHAQELEPLFEQRFPDDLGIPTDSWSYLHSVTGVGLDQEQYRCRTVEVLERSFRQKIAPALNSKALPYLDKLTNLTAIIPMIKSKLMLGIALSEAGRDREATPLLIAERERLLKADRANPIVKAYLEDLAARLHE